LDYAGRTAGQVSVPTAILRYHIPLSQAATRLLRGALLASVVAAAPALAQGGVNGSAVADATAISAEDAAALMARAWALQTGKGAPKDIDKATELFWQALEAGDTSAAGALVATGYAYRSKGASAESMEKGFAVFQKLASAGMDEALIPLAYAYRSGKGVERDPVKAVGLLQQAADAGLPDAFIPLALSYQHGQGVSADLDSATAVIARALAANVEGAADLLVAVGYSYQQRKTAEDDIKAFGAFTAAANAGASGALMPLALAYQSGRGAEKDEVRAGGLLKQAVDAGIDDALVMLGLAYMSASGLPKDLDKAVSLFKQAAAKKVDGAGGALVAAAYAMQSGKSDPGNYSGAVEVFEAAAALGVADAYYPLGQAYRRGKGVRTDRDQALQWLTKAAEAGKPGSGVALKSLDANAYVRYIQVQLIGMGLLDGPPTGIANRATIRAILGYCRARSIQADCAAGPLTGKAAEVLVQELAKP
jgi:TPR repeat protein